MKLLIPIFLLLSWTGLSAQTYYYYSRTEYTYGPYYFDQTLNFVDRMIQKKELEKKRQEMQAQMKARCQELDDYYQSLESYPSRIVDGWHKVMIIAGDAYIGDRKVLVQDNKVKTMVWDDWMEEPLTFTGPIQNAKTAVRMENGKGPMEGLVHVYFMNSITDSTSNANPPLEAGSVTFWCSLDERDLGRIYVQFEDAEFGAFVNHLFWTEPPVCGDVQQITVYYKPGVYKYKGMRKYSENSLYGREIIEGKVEILPGACQLVEIYDPSKKRKKPKKR